MWAHYANEHKGFCVEYNVEDLPGNSNEFFDMIHPVFYTDNIFDATSYLIATTPELKNPEFLQQAALIKTKDWAYEDEWRLVAYIEAKPPWPLNLTANSKLKMEGSVRSVILGLNAHDSIAKNVIDAIRQKAPHIALKRVIRDELTAALTIATL